MNNFQFSFNYGEGHFVLSAEGNACYKIDDGITVSVKKTEYPKYDACEWVMYFENASEENSEIFSDILDCDTTLPLTFPENKRPGYKLGTGDACVITMNGMVDSKYYQTSDKISATEYGFNYEYLDKAPEKTKTAENTGAISSEGMMPFFDVTASGEGYIAAIGWTGDWRATFTKCGDGIQMKSGLKETRFYLNPGEKIRTTSTLVMHYGKSEDKYNKFRRLIKNHISHKACTGATRDGLMACELWGGLPSEQMVKRLNEFTAHGIRFEDIWIDAGWYGNCTKCDEAFSGDWALHTGEWEINKRVHPMGLCDVKEAAAKMGANLMIWFEPERAIIGTPITEEHPEWFIELPNSRSKILNYANSDARNYICSLISDYIEKLGMSCYRQDFNTRYTDCFKKNDEENRRGITEIKQITGMYEMWDTLLERFPHLIIDNCSGGGRRIDIETLKRSIPFFRSDYQCVFNENPEVLQVHNSGISHYLPYNGCTSKTKADTYAIRSSYSSSWGGAFYNAIFQEMSEEDFVWAKKITEEYRSIRKYFSMDFYNHGSKIFDDTAWTVWQYHDPDTDSGIIMAFRRENSPFDTVKIELRGLSEGERVFTSLNDGEVSEGNSTITVTLPEKRSSAIIEYRKK